MYARRPARVRERLAPPYGNIETIVPRREGPALLLGPWDWLEQLRFRFDLSIEILDKQRQYVLAPAPAPVRAPDIRATITSPDDERLREAAAAVFRTGKARSFAAGGLHIRVFPLFAGQKVPRAVVGLLLLGTEAPAPSATRPDPADNGDNRLDAAGQWLTAAVEATIDATALRGDETRAAERFGTIIDIVEAFGRMNDDRQLVDLTVEAWRCGTTRTSAATARTFRVRSCSRRGCQASTCRRHANMLGLYYLPKLYIARRPWHWRATKGLRRGPSKGAFCEYEAFRDGVCL